MSDLILRGGTVASDQTGDAVSYTAAGYEIGFGDTR